MIGFRPFVLRETGSFFLEAFVVLQEGRSLVQGEAALKTLKGKRIDVLFTLSLPPLAPGLDHVIVSLVDISERKRAEEALQRGEGGRERGGGGRIR